MGLRLRTLAGAGERPRPGPGEWLASSIKRPWKVGGALGIRERRSHCALLGRSRRLPGWSSLGSLRSQVPSVQNFVGVHRPSLWPVVSLNFFYHRYSPPFRAKGVGTGFGGWCLVKYRSGKKMLTFQKCSIRWTYVHTGTQERVPGVNKAPGQGGWGRWKETPLLERGEGLGRKRGGAARGKASKAAGKGGRKRLRADRARGEAGGSEESRRPEEEAAGRRHRRAAGRGTSEEAAKKDSSRSSVRQWTAGAATASPWQVMLWLREKGGREAGRPLFGGHANKCASPWQPAEGKRSPRERNAGEVENKGCSRCDSYLGEVEDGIDKANFMGEVVEQ